MAQVPLIPGSPCGPAGIVWSDGNCIPISVTHPAPFAVAMFDIYIPIFSALIVAFLAWRSFRAKTLTWSLLMAIASASCWWLETFGDWGQHLSYSPVLNHYLLDWPFTAPHNPTYMPIAYALYWWAHAWAILALVKFVRQRFLPNISMGQGIILCSIPLTWAWNLANEGPATAAGLWTYDPPFGPAILWARGTYWSYLWPSGLMVGWINLIAWMVRLPEEQTDFNRIERLFHLDDLLAKPGWSRMRGSTNPMDGGVAFQFCRLAAWIVFFNITFILTLDLPLILMRVITGSNSFYLP